MEDLARALQRGGGMAAAAVGGKFVLLGGSKTASSEFVSGCMPPAGSDACARALHVRLQLGFLPLPPQPPPPTLLSALEKVRQHIRTYVFCRTVFVGIECDVTVAMEVGWRGSVVCVGVSISPTDAAAAPLTLLFTTVV
ncbi:hypothetical protein ABPG75_011872 [Micractinium tetrahymenae]